MHDADVGGGLFDLAQQVAGQQHRRPGPGRQVTEKAAHVGDAVGVQPIGRLVEDQHRRGPQHGPGQPQPLTHAQRIVRDPPPGVFGHLDHLKHPLDLRPGQADEAAGQVQILPPRQIAVEAVRLQQRPDLARRAQPVFGNVDAADPCGAAARPDQPQQHLQRRGLARAVAAEEAIDGPFGHGHRHRIHRQTAVEAAGQCVRLDGGRHGGDALVRLTLT